MDDAVPRTDLLRAFRAGDPRALARAISHCESGRGAELIRALYPLAGRAVTVGLTGPPGVGKSTLTSAIVTHLRRLGKTVGVISVDPSSPFSHGALLGDRIRLSEHFVDPDVFIRSMASRGHLGGLAGATADAVSLMDAFGKDVVLIETVGVGQSEIEIADVFVVNKSDHPMALQLQREIRSMMEMLNFSGWVPKLVATQALQGKGVDELWKAVVAHDAWLRESGALRDKRRAAFAHRVRQLALGTLERGIEDAVTELGDDLDPYAAADTVLQRFGVQGGVNATGHARPHSGVRATVKGL